MARFFSLIALGAILLAEPAFAHGPPERFDTTTPYQYWILGENTDGKETVYLRQMNLGRNSDTGNYHGFVLITDTDSRLVGEHYATQYEVEFNCENRTFAPRAVWYYAVDGQQSDVIMMYQKDLEFNPIKPGGVYEMASKILCDGASTNGLTSTEPLKVSQLIGDQIDKYAKVAQGH